MKILSKFLIIFILFFLSPIKVHSAEVLQIKSSNSILLGDQNRNISIKLFCVNVKSNDEKDAVKLLKKEFPRGSRVKIKPFGFEDNVLTAKVFNLSGTKEMSELLVSGDLTNEDCLR